jgi:hypothetical protein
LLAEVFGKTVELMLPEHAVRLQPLRCLLHRRCTQATTPHPALSPALHKPCPLEHRQVLAHSRQRHVERLRQLANRQLSARQSRDNCAARGVCERGKDTIEPYVVLVNHSV